MRIAFFTDTYLPNVDGVVTTLLNTKQELERRGHEVYIFSPGTKQQKENNKDPRVYYFTSTSFKPYPDYRIALFNFFSPLKIIKDLNINVIHSHGLATTSLAAIRSSQTLDIPAVATFHTLVSEAMHYITSNDQLRSVLQRISWRYLIWHYGNYKKAIVPTEWVRTIFTAHQITNTVVLPSGINIDQFADADPKRARKDLKIGNDPMVLHVGRVAKEKRLELLIETAPSVLNVMPNTKFVITGKGPAEKYYKELVTKNGLDQHFIFTGYVDKALLKDIYAAADAFVFPSLFDTQGLAVIESMACGTPVVVSKEAAPAEYVTDGVNGYVFNSNFDLQEKIITAIKNKKNVRNAAIETAKKFDIKITVDRLLEIYRSVGAKVE